jgi:hypothetical protein
MELMSDNTTSERGLDIVSASVREWRLERERERERGKSRRLT